MKSLYNCDKCEHVFHMKKELDDHIQEAHRIVAVLTCKECKRVFNSNKTLVDHIWNDHSNERASSSVINSVTDVIVIDEKSEGESFIEKTNRNMEASGPKKVQTSEIIEIIETVITAATCVDIEKEIINKIPTEETVSAAKEAEKDNDFDSDKEVETQISKLVDPTENVTQTVDIPCNGCISKDRDIKLLNEHVSETEAQIDAQIDAFKTKLIEKEKERQKLIKEYENAINLKVKSMEKENEKIIKNYEDIIKEHSEELSLSRDEVKKVVEKM